MFEIGAKFDDGADGWSVDKGEKKAPSKEIKSFEKHQLVFTKEKRKGKVVTIVKPFYLEKKALQTVLKTLKKRLATGGSIHENTLELQGDIKKVLISELQSLGFGFRR